MAKIIFMSIPGHGHVNPTLPVVNELVARGHTVLYYNTEEFRLQVEHAGASFYAYPEGGLTAAAIANSVHNLAQVAALSLETSESMVEWMVRQIEQEQPDLLIHDSVCLWGMMCGRVLNMPTISSITTFVLEGIKISWSPRLLLHMLPNALPVLPKIINARRRLTQKYGKHSLPKNLFPAVGDLNIVFTSRAFQPATSFIDERFCFVGPSINAAMREGNFSFEQLTRRPVIYISLGTIHSRITFYRQCFTAFRDYPAQFILCIGNQTDIAALGEIPNNFMVRNSVPQLEVLQQVDLFITHGGMNSINEALYYGVPMVIIPQQLEQYFNGLQVVAQNAGIMLADPLRFGHITTHDLRAAVDKLIHDNQHYKSAAQRIGITFKESGGYLRAVEEIEAFCRERGITPSEPIPVS
jgi:hypothetical protein